MTLYQVFKRFLKDNDLYAALLYNNGVEGKLFRQIFKGEERFNEYVFCMNPFEIFAISFTDYPMFRGNSCSVQRKRYYALCRKWKYILSKHIFLQTNIEKGDILYDMRGKKCVVIDESKYLKEYKIVTAYENKEWLSKRNVFYFKMAKGKDLVVNLYYKDNKNRCYGKIDGKFNEIQL